MIKIHFILKAPFKTLRDTAHSRIETSKTATSIRVYKVIKIKCGVNLKSRMEKLMWNRLL